MSKQKKAMISLTLPDSSVKEYSQPPSGLHLAADISPSLAKKSVAIKCDGVLRDLSRPIENDCAVELVLRDSEEGLEILRHDAAHVMAQAVQELFPGTQVTIGPVIENGFYYDFAREEKFRPGDLAEIEKRMAEIVARDLEIVREVWPREEAVQHFREAGEDYKAEIIAAIPDGDPVTIYRQGEWLDLCRGPHLPSTGRLGKAFKLTKLAGAYWRGDSRNPMLQRIYGTAWADSKDLHAHLTMLEEAQRRDHRKLGREMNLFHMQEEARGMVFWHPRGWTLYRTLQDWLRARMRANGYQEIHTPQLLDRALWEKSGHWDKYRENMFTSEADDHALALKPMSCPGHVQVFNQGLKSYRDLPLRLAEFGSCHRYEASGALYGLMRVRAFVQDDAHIFCTEDQIASETAAFCALLNECYAALGFSDVRAVFAGRPQTRIGPDAIWDKAENALRTAVAATGLECGEDPDGGTFYGPKLDFHLRDAIGRVWQCGTLQVDFNLPERLSASYIGEDNSAHIPVMLHRAIFGSIERFLGILIEHYEGRFPLWLAPVQAVVAPITNAFDEYAKTAAAQLAAAGLRVITDLRSEKISYKVREHSLARIPLVVAVGAREQESKSVNVRRGGKQEVMLLQDAAEKLAAEAKPPA